MRVLLIGPGAIGRYVGAALQLAGNEVVFAARPRTAQALQQGGIQLIGPRGDVQLPNVQVCSDPKQVTQPFDLAISCVKLYDAESSAREWQPLLANAQAVISLQNGIDGPDRIARGASLQRVFGGLAYVAAVLEEDGVVRYQSDMSSITFGGPGALHEPSLDILHQQLRNADSPIRLGVELVEDIRTAQWCKHTGLATNAALTCLVRQPAGVIYHDKDLLALAVQSISEVAAVGRAEGASIPEGHEQETLQKLRGFPAGMFASMHHDLAAGRPLELDGLIGTVVRLGAQHRVPTCFHAFAYACLKPYTDGVRR